MDNGNIASSLMNSSTFDARVDGYHSAVLFGSECTCGSAGLYYDPITYLACGPDYTHIFTHAFRL